MVETIIALIIFLFPLAYSPGPGNMFFTANGARFGFWATLPASIGYHIATWIVTVMIGFGMIRVLGNDPRLFETIKIIGSIYVFWLASKLFRAGLLEMDKKARPAGFWDGVVLMILNPKAYVIIALMFSQFLEVTDKYQWKEVLLISSIFTLNNFVAFSIWTAAGDGIARLFTTQSSARKLNIAFGTILALVALWMLLI